MEKPIEYYEESLEYVTANGLAISFISLYNELIAMVKARDKEIEELKQAVEQQPYKLIPVASQQGGEVK